MMVTADGPIAHGAARLLVVNGMGEVEHHGRDRLAEFLRPGDLLVANDAATIPASLHGIHQPTGSEVEIHEHVALPESGECHPPHRELVREELGGRRRIVPEIRARIGRELGA